MNRGLIAVSVFLMSSCGSGAQPTPDRVADEVGVRAVAAGLTDAWRAGDGDAWATYFATDADFTVWFGLRMAGREEIAWGHNLIFDDFYANTVFELDVTKVTFPSRDIAIAMLEGRVLRPDSPRPMEPDAAPMMVLRRTEDTWEIVAFQNTPSAVPELRAYGDLAGFKAWATTQAKE